MTIFYVAYDITALLLQGFDKHLVKRLAGSKYDVHI